MQTDARPCPFCGRQPRQNENRNAHVDRCAKEFAVEVHAAVVRSFEEHPIEPELEHEFRKAV
jgi:hypothetical protein